jgi:hypothetical protein
MENRNGVEIPENEDSTSTDSEDIFYDTETQTNATNGKGSEITKIQWKILRNRDQSNAHNTHINVLIIQSKMLIFHVDYV